MCEPAEPDFGTHAWVPTASNVAYLCKIPLVWYNLESI